MNDEANSTSSQPASASRYLRVESRKLTFREYWNMLRSWQVIIPWTAKLLNRPMRLATGLPCFESVRELKVEESNFSGVAREALRSMREQCQRMGFHSPQFHSYIALRQDTQTSFISFLHPSGAALRLMHTIGTQVHPPKVSMVATLLSELQDGTFFLTTGQRPQFLTAPGIVINRVVGANLDQLMESHLLKLEEFRSSNPARTFDSAEAMDQLWDRYELLCREFGLQRGIYVFMSSEEVAAEQKQVAAVATAAGATPENPEVLMELDKLQNQKAGWGSMLMILVVSLALFVGAGARQWSWEYLLILVPVLFFHELGHYLAMRAFNYRNLRMFFIPFFGAAVSGQHYNVAGWKKVIVSLMGPLPGILLGAVIGGAGLILHQPLLMKVAMVTLVLNGFNLLPVLPLDGGWVVHTLLFSRHALLDTGFRVVAALALAASGIFGQNKILMYLSIPMLIGIPAAYRQARIATKLRKIGLEPASANDPAIPVATAQAIIGELKQASRKLQSSKMLAQEALQIFESLNARPPGWVATIGLLFAHIASLGMAVVFSVVFQVAQRGDVRAALAVGAQAPKHGLVCGSSHFWPGGQASNLMVMPRNTLIATFSGSVAAENSFQSLTNHLPASASVRTLGASLLLVLPANLDFARKEWLAKLEKQAKDVFVDQTNFPTSMSVSCAAPTEQIAKSIAEELDGYFSTLPGEFLVPPWFPQDPRTAQERVQHQLARQTFVKLQQNQFDRYANSDIMALQKTIATAQRKGDQAEVDALRGQVTQLRQKSRLQTLDRMRKSEHGQIDTNLADLYLAAAADETGTNHTHDQEMARRMGQLPLVNGTVDPAADLFSTGAGLVRRKKARLELAYLTFTHIADGAPALIEWLCQQGCTDFRYEFQAGAGLGDMDRE